MFTDTYCRSVFEVFFLQVFEGKYLIQLAAVQLTQVSSFVLSVATTEKKRKTALLTSSESDECMNGI